MAEKALTNATFRCGFGEKSKADALAKVKGFSSTSEYLRDLLIKDIAAAEEYLNCLSKEFELATNTVSTVQTPFLELTSDPKPKPQVQKKPSCFDQLSLICHPNTK
ncbi:hypothetical protein [Acinetobacter sp. ANC 4640]